MAISVVVPSKTASNLLPCIAAVRKHEPGARIIVVDDGVDRSAGDFAGVEWVEGIRPFCFARNVNAGMRRAFSDPSCDAVVECNDDALLVTPGGFSIMAQAAREHPEYGVISATTNLAGNPQQKPHGIGLRDATRTVAFVCVLIPRIAVGTIGFLDERFGGVDERGRIIYGWDDNDYCRRLRNAGMRLGIHDGCMVDHGSLKSTFRGSPRAAGDIEPGRRVYVAKWGDCE